MVRCGVKSLIASQIGFRANNETLSQESSRPFSHRDSHGGTLLRRSEMMSGSRPTLHCLFTAWSDIGVIFGELTGSASGNLYRLADTIGITELAWKRWRSRLHASAIDDQELFVRLTGFIDTLRKLLGLWRNEGDRCDAQQLHQAYMEALELHVALKDTRRPPPFLKGPSIAPPVPLRIRHGCSKRLELVVHRDTRTSRLNHTCTPC